MSSLDLHSNSGPLFFSAQHISLRNPTELKAYSYLEFFQCIKINQSFFKIQN